MPVTKASNPSFVFEREEQFAEFDKPVALAPKRSEITIASSLAVYPLGRDFLRSTQELRDKAEVQFKNAANLEAALTRCESVLGDRVILLDFGGCQDLHSALVSLGLCLQARDAGDAGLSERLSSMFTTAVFATAIASASLF